MKKISLILGTVALALGLSQCNKPEQPVINLGEGVETDVMFTTSGDNGTKGYFVSAGTALDYKWQASDEIVVYEGSDRGFEKIGVLTDPKLEDEGLVATFEGTLKITKSANKIRFVHYGPNASEGSISFASQNGSFDAVSENVIGVYETDIVESGVYSGNLELPFSIIKLDVSAFGTAAGNAVVVENANSTTMTINKDNGDVSFSGGTTITLNGVSNSSKEYYMIVTPGNTTLKFSGNEKEGSKAANISADRYYTNNGESIVIRGRGLFIGAFSKNTNGDMVEIARANLVRIGDEWMLPYNQYDFYTGPKVPGYPNGGPYSMDGVYHANGGPDNIYGSFAWSLGTKNNYGVETSGEYLHLEEGDEFVDWGTQFGHNSYTLTGDEFKHVLFGRNESLGKTLSKYVYLNAIDSHVAGYVILPDATQNPETILAQVDGNMTLDKFNELQDTYGMVFLPSVGSRSPANGSPSTGDVIAVGGYNDDGEAWFWTNTIGSDGTGNLPKYYHFRGEGDGSYAGLNLCSYGVGYGVRLVRDL